MPEGTEGTRAAANRAEQASTTGPEGRKQRSKNANEKDFEDRQPDDGGCPFDRMLFGQGYHQDTGEDRISARDRA